MGRKKKAPECSVLVYPGFLLRAERELRGWNQSELAERLDISAQYLCDIELGRRPVSFEIARKLTSHFGHPTVHSAKDWARMQFEYDWHVFESSRGEP